MTSALGGLAAGALVMLLLANGAQAQQAAYTWTGMGINVPGSSKCNGYKMTIDVTIEGKAVKGIFQQAGRDQRNFQAQLDDKGMFKTTAIVGGGNKMDVVGTINASESKVVLDGYCKFDAKLTRK
jgi:hypothetical protein